VSPLVGLYDLHGSVRASVDPDDLYGSVSSSECPDDLHGLSCQ
jgi:hypothetical protein